MGNLPALLRNATPPVSRFVGEMSNKRQFYNNGVTLEKKFSILAKFTDFLSNYINK
jgi:hypothetical protein